MARVATSTTGWAKSWQGFDPFRIVFRLLTSIRFALLLLLAVIIAALTGVIFPQAADDVRAVPAAYNAFTEFQRGRYGVFTTAMRRLGIFEVFHSFWFNGLIIVLLVAVAVCTANRIPPIVRNVRHPIRRVNDRFFTAAHHRADFETPADAAAIERALRKSRYRVERSERDGATYLFAERFPWAQYGTFLSHLSLILFMSGAVVTKLLGFATFISIPQGGTYPVFPTIHAGQMQIENLQAGDTPDAAGLPTRYFSNLAVFRDGRQICSGTSTVNNPMHCAGYTLHQTTFSPDGAALQVRDLATGQIVYQEVQQMGTEGSAPSPHLVIRSAAGNTIFDDNVVLAPFNPGDATELYAILPIPTGAGTPPLVIALKAVETSDKKWSFGILHPKSEQPGDDRFQLELAQGQSASGNGYQFSVTDLIAAPLSVVQGIPGVQRAALLQLATTAKGERYLDVLDMGNGQLGVGASDGSSAATAATSAAPANSTAPAGAPPAIDRLDLLPGVPQVQNGYEYTFLGRRTITGITVRRDPGSTFIWVATALMILGLGITFYLPRRRLWAKITPERTLMAGVADRVVNFAAEMRRIGARAGSPDAIIPDME